MRCCLPHIGGDSPVETSGEKRNAAFRGDPLAPHATDSRRYLGPGNIVMKFRNFNPLKGPGMETSGYEDVFADVGREEMERRFSERRTLFLDLYDREQPMRSLSRYMEEAQRKEGYTHRPAASSGLVSLYLGGSVPKKHLRKGGLPECQLLGFVDEQERVGCLAHPFAETSQGYDGRDRVGFFSHTGCCGSVGCEASQEFRFLSPAALKIFDKTVEGMSWYRYSRHATSVLVHYLRGYDHLLQRLDAMEILDTSTLQQLVRFTNALHDEWPLRRENGNAGRRPKDPPLMDSLEILKTEIPLAERILYITLDTGFLQDGFTLQLKQARDHLEGLIEAPSPPPLS